jgi:hypothetical protein
MQVLWGASTVFKVMTGISQWLMPHKYIFLSPFSMINQEEYRQYRQIIRGPNNFSFTHKGKSIDDDELLPFSFTFEEWKVARERMKEYLTSVEGSTFDKVRQRNVLNLSLSHIFGNLPNREYHELNEYHRIDSWMHYCEYIKNSSLPLERPFRYEDFPMWRKFNYKDFSHEKHLRLEIKDETYEPEEILSLDSDIEVG